MSARTGHGFRSSTARRLGGVLSFALVALVAACADKVLRPQPAGSPRFTLQLTATAQRSPVAQRLFVAAVYFSSVLTESDSLRILDTATVQVTGGAQQVTLKVDLSNCLADPTRRGSRDACSLYVFAFLGPATLDLADRKSVV